MKGKLILILQSMILGYFWNTEIKYNPAHIINYRFIIDLHPCVLLYHHENNLSQAVPEVRKHERIMANP